MRLKPPTLLLARPDSGRGGRRLAGLALAGWVVCSALAGAAGVEATAQNKPVAGTPAAAPAGQVNPPEPQSAAPHSFGYAAGPVHNPAALLGGGKIVREALQKGGYIIYMRHGRTDLDQIGRESGNRAEGKIDMAKCVTQRNLSEEGRAELKAAGEQFRKAAIPIDKTLASPYCRTKETAALFTPRLQVVPVLASFNSVPAREGELERLFSQRPAPGKNTLIVAHGLTLRGLTGFAIGEGHALVMEPGNFKTIVARIAPNEWAGVASAR